MSQRESWIKQGKCPECGGDYWAGRGYVGHTKDCPRRQDKEREALAEVEAPFMPMIRWPEPGPGDPDRWYPREPLQRKRGY